MPTTNFANMYNIYMTTGWPDITTYTNTITPTGTINTTAIGAATTWATTANGGWMYYDPVNTNGILWQHYDPVAAGTALKDVLNRLANELEEPEESEIIELLGE